MRQEIENNLIYLLRQIKEVLDEEMIEIWLECGTLLGAVRDGKFIPWEHDLDFGVFREKFPYNLQILIKEKLSERGFKVVIYKNHMNISISKSVGIWADINYYDIINENAIVPHRKPINVIGKLLSIFYNSLLTSYYHITSYKHENSFTKYLLGIIVRMFFISISHILPTLLRQRLAEYIYSVYKKIGSKDVYWVVPIHYLTNLSKIKFYGKEFKIPFKVDDYLSYRYGKDWKIPKKDWVTERDDGAVLSIKI